MIMRKVGTLSVAIVAIMLVSCGGSSADDSSTPSTSSVATTATTPDTSVATSDETTITTEASNVAKILVTVGVDSGSDRVENVKLNQEVELTLVNPKADDEFHVHGYDLGGGTTKAGDEKTFAFVATEAGDFEVESHVSETVLVVIHVS